ncbi:MULTISPECIES: endonuclease/exonuclease/phosphatase family protein [unclassified Rhizobium]|uniref:endonuclease/exonuclease/phosphatase family protein n=1 Tax=unclassified Rhizobium TaxID=2613769 RepID=UPI000DDD4BFB|nr:MULTISPECIES: endonuclease/exonuclease/phosphatase family protein [unclassified Rhizobium]MBB3287689.1 endonuclease/exonuclease/phosphatase (EEP) superfamily protein YafD [Rhizobium sp. BK252]MBB3402707.1 endonuclease/exonuclease/phosphatase (EEP) superfamily protein YafD [Rhizobium sp. BK289]MBB3415283.1 endonuclease/exonuclease/phosphatase (EEP) superfamily protein YafD [Rhizobium sp. BK284]MBB3483172.1 endonuclease/exonuclease/phosphatase (EEP) superfamily protein YafD [Rhizobium sp. BK34
MRHTIYCVLCVLATLALGILAARYIADSWLLAFFESLQTHVSLFAILLALIAFVFKRHWYALFLTAAGTVLLVHSLLMLQEYAASSLLASAEAGGKNFRLLSFNIEDSNFENGARIADFVITSKADVVEIFEAGPILSEMDRITKVYPYRIGCGVMTTDCDSLLLSKRPFQSQLMRSLGSLWDNRFILAAIDMDGQPVNFASVHLSKPYFDAFHQIELGLLAPALNDVKGPLILAGDFNASVIAPDMREFLAATGLRHAFPEPATWPIALGAYGVSIDHVFARAPLRLISVKQIRNAMGSNHFGLMTDFSVPRSGGSNDAAIN